MKEGWTPPVDAWQARFGPGQESISCAYLGAQSLGEETALAVIDRLARLIARDDVERASFVDGQGYHNEVLILYWSSAEQRDAFWNEAPIARWWEEARQGQVGCGIWREMFTLRPSRFETLFSQRHARGSGKLATDLGTPICEHGYWGGMRDRIADSAHDALDCSGQGQLIESGNARHITLIPHEGMCVIRSGQDWSACGAEERAQYQSTVLPALIEGMNYLSDNPAETGCRFSRFLQEKAHDGKPLESSFGHAAFQSLAHLERWAHTHPTHLAIFNAFMAMAVSQGANCALSLWHEVFVLDAASSRFDYIDCHPGTGLLPGLQ